MPPQGAIQGNQENNAPTYCEVDIHFRYGVPLATLTAASGMMDVCADDIRKNFPGDVEALSIKRLLSDIEGRVDEIRGWLSEGAYYPERSETNSDSTPPEYLWGAKFDSLKMVFVPQGARNRANSIRI